MILEEYLATEVGQYYLSVDNWVLSNDQQVLMAN